MKASEEFITNSSIMISRCVCALSRSNTISHLRLQTRSHARTPSVRARIRFSEDSAPRTRAICKFQ